MSQAKRASKARRPSKAVSVLGIAGMSLAVTGDGASASIAGSATGIQSPNTTPRQLVTLGEEEMSDVSLATFYVFDKENARTSQTGVREAHGCAGCAGCGHGCVGCAGVGGCGHGCAGVGVGGCGHGGAGCRGGGCRGCRGFRGCGGCWGGCGCCASWGACNVC
jgi:hypothetical protein